MIYVHGPGGVGKSALLRAVARDAASDEREVLALDGRAIGASLDALEAALVGGCGAAVVLIDEVDELAATGTALRGVVLAHLTADTVVLLASRRPPGREWFDDGVEHLVQALALEPLPADDCRAMLARHGLTDPDVVEDLIAWSGGYPLALAVAARQGSLPRRGGDVERADDLGERLVEHLAGRELDDLDPLVLEVAALARAVDAQMLAAVLPSRPTRASLRQLRESSVTERLGPRVALHAVVRQAVRSRAGVGAHRRSELVVRLADHLATRIPDDPELVVDLADLVEDLHLRAVVMGSSTTHVVDRVRPADAEAALARWNGTGTEWGERLRRWCRSAPGHVICVRTTTGRLAAIGISGPLDGVPAWAEDLPELAPVLAHARTHGVDHDAVFLHDMHLVPAPDDPTYDDIRGVLIGAVSIRHGVTRRHMYFTSDDPMPADCVDAFGYREDPALVRSDGERVLRTWTADMGVDGVVGQLQDTVRSEQGVESPRASAFDGRRAQALVDALRHYDDDLALRSSILAEGAGPGDEAAQTRARVLAALDQTFGRSEGDVLIRRALELTYLTRDGGPARAMAELHMSRSTLFRYLKRGRGRLIAAAT